MSWCLEDAKRKVTIFSAPDRRFIVNDGESTDKLQFLGCTCVGIEGEAFICTTTTKTYIFPLDQISAVEIEKEKE